MIPASFLTGLYVILDAQASGGRSLLDILREAAAAGARLFQYRDKTSSTREVYRQAVRLRQAAADAGAVFVVNDRCDLALAVEADGVHLGQQDMPLFHARSLLGSGKIIGVSTHRAEDVQAATKGGADYLGFGPIFPTGTKPDHEPVAGIESLRAIRPLTHLPVFAIGGMTVGTVEAVIRAGANGVAVVSAVVEAPDVAGAVRAFMARLA
ncbi:MAG: thiamine phosphate synthase [Nitrospirae bacterium]|nr:thiamine phosphate synthase [Nitrospirota bacterium]